MHQRVAAPEEDWSLREGTIFEKGVTPMRSFVVEPMQFGRLYLAGDAAHIVSPMGAKGLNLAVADVCALADALAHWLETGDEARLDAYSETCLRRVWRVQHFSYWMTSMLHRFQGDDAFQLRLQLSQLEYVTSSVAAATTLAENYVGMPFARAAGSPTSSSAVMAASTHSGAFQPPEASRSHGPRAAST